MFEVDDETFDAIVDMAIDSIPEEFLDDIENLEFVIEKEPGPQHMQRLDEGTVVGGRILLGLYSGVPLTDRGYWYGHGNMPDVITIFQGPHERMARSYEGLIESVRRTVVHEVGHYFGMDEDQLREMGYA